jgi:hypothetical protein
VTSFFSLCYHELLVRFISGGYLEDNQGRCGLDAQDDDQACGREEKDIEGAFAGKQRSYHGR